MPVAVSLYSLYRPTPHMIKTLEASNFETLKLSARFDLPRNSDESAAICMRCIRCPPQQTPGEALSTLKEEARKDVPPNDVSPALQHLVNEKHMIHFLCQISWRDKRNDSSRRVKFTWLNRPSCGSQADLLADHIRSPYRP